MSDTSEFFCRVENWLHELPYASLRIFAYVIDKRVHFAFGNLDIDPSPPLIDFISETEYCLALSRRMLTSDAIRLVADWIKTGLLKLPDLPPIYGFSSKTVENASFHNIWSGLNKRWPRDLSLTLPADSLAKYPVPGSAKIDFALRAANPPFDGLPDLYQSLNFVRRPEFNELVIRAHSPVTHDAPSSCLRSGKLAVAVCVTDGVDRAEVGIGFRSLDLSSDRGVLKLVSEDDNRLMFEGLEKHGPRYQIFVNYKGENLDRAIVCDPAKQSSMIGALLSSFDKELAYMRQFLTGCSKDPAKDLENGLALLFSMLGFSVIQLGLTEKLTNGPDLILLTPRSEIIVLECTTQDLNHNQKLSKLEKRTEQIKETLRENKYEDVIVHAAIVTALSRNAISIDLKVAGNKKICVVGKEDIDKFFEMTTSAPNPQARVEELLGLIPKI